MIEFFTQWEATKVLPPVPNSTEFLLFFTKATNKSISFALILGCMVVGPLEAPIASEAHVRCLMA
jgi:hypothetical protein